MLRLSIQKEEGGGWIFILQNGYSLLPKIFTPSDFYKSHLTIRLIQKFCEDVKIIMIYLNIYYDKTCHSKVNNTFTIFSNKTNGQTWSTELNKCKYFGMEGVVNAYVG
jgi:hypothetical protein